MNESKISVRYAKAIFQLAQEKGMLENVRNDFEMVRLIMKDFVDFNMYLKSPVVKPSKKVNLVNELLKGKISDISLHFLGLVIQNKREDQIESIVRRFTYIYREHKGIKSAVITTAVHLDENLKQKLQTILVSTYKTDVELELKENNSIIGGFILKIQDQQYDASVASELKRMRTTLLSGT
jgi:F-type H+-transporting ATPase subunit delta